VFHIEYYTYHEKCPILDFLKSLPKKDAAKILREIDLLQEFGLSLGQPHLKKFTDTNGLWELRVKLSNNNYRIFYFTVKDNTFVILNAFHKKTQKTPSRELSKAISYMNEYIERSDKNDS
jgi:phage-related protein